MAARILNLMRGRAPWMLLLAFLLLMLAAQDGIARPGGGSSYDGGSSSSSSSSSSSGWDGGSSSSDSSGDDGEFIAALIWLLINYPEVGVPLIICLAIYGIWNHYRGPQTTVSSAAPVKALREKAQRSTAIVAQFRKQDPQFSATLFLDFAQHLYYRFHSQRSTPQFAHLRPYLSQNLLVQTQQQNSQPVQVSAIVIGNAIITSLNHGKNTDDIRVEIDANYTETRHGKHTRFGVREQWNFRRKTGLQSPAPDKMNADACPHCGSALETKQDGTCTSCGTLVQPQEETWALVSIQQLERREVNETNPGAYVAEKGTSLPTRIDPLLQENGQKLAAAHGVTQAAAWFREFGESVVKPAFTAIYQAWEAKQWGKVRPLMTDHLFRSQHYWMELYRQQGWTNKLENLEITRVEPAKADLDPWYEALTVRISAKVLDYVVDDRGKLVTGDKHHLRVFTEYWTFIRRTGVQKPLLEFRTDACPNCGAPLKIGMSGVCEYCNSKVTTGEFGWVLAQITQDEVYVG